MESSQLIISILGGLGLLFYGLRSLSFALENLVGEYIYDGVGQIKESSLKAFGLGFIGTLSVGGHSSITVLTVMSLVNAGLVKLRSGLLTISGATLGLGLACVFYTQLMTFSVGSLGPLLIGLGVFPGLLTKKNSFIQAGRILFGLGMVVFGFEMMLGQWQQWALDPQAQSWQLYLHQELWWFGLALFFICFTLSFMLDSSLTLLGLILTIFHIGLLKFEQAFFCVLIAQMGSASVSFWSSKMSSLYARRVAIAHSLFPVLMFVLALVLSLSEVVNFEALAHQIFTTYFAPEMRLSLMLFVFLGLGVALQALMVGVWEKIVRSLVPEDPIKEQYRLMSFGDSKDLIPASALSQCHLQLNKQVDIVKRMYRLTNHYVVDTEELGPRTLAKIKDYERIIDNITDEITDYIRVLLEKPLLKDQSGYSLSLVRVSKELESISDCLDKMATQAAALKERELVPEMFLQKVEEYQREVFEYFVEVTSLCDEYEAISESRLEAYQERAYELRQKSSQGRSEFIDYPSDSLPLELRLCFLDYLSLQRKIRAHVQNIAESIASLEQQSLL